jgi:hypothetical protein
MAAPLHRKIARWIIDHLLWDPTGTSREGFVRALWATRKLSIAILGSALLDWREWVTHHPPEIVLIAFIHFAFVLAAIALVVRIGQWFSRSDKKSPGREPKGL